MKGKLKWILVGVAAVVAVGAFIPQVRTFISDMWTKIKPN